MSESTLHNEFLAQIEPILKADGYKGRFLKSGKFMLWKGKVRLALYHCPMPYDDRYERICFMYQLKAKELKAMGMPGGLVLTNTLAFNNPDLHFIYTSTGPILVSYTCTIQEPADIISQLRFAQDLYLGICDQFKELLPQINNNFK